MGSIEVDWDSMVRSFTVGLSPKGTIAVYRRPLSQDHKRYFRTVFADLSIERAPSKLDDYLVSSFARRSALATNPSIYLFSACDIALLLKSQDINAPLYVGHYDEQSLQQFVNLAISKRAIGDIEKQLSALGRSEFFYEHEERFLYNRAAFECLGEHSILMSGTKTSAKAEAGLSLWWKESEI